EPQIVVLAGVAGDHGVLQHAVGLAVAVLVDAGVAAGRGDVDLLAPVRVERGGLVELRGGDGDGVRIGGRVADLAAAVVAGGADHDHALVVGVLDRLGEHRRGHRPAERHVDDLGAVVGGPADAVGDARDRARAARREHLDGHDLGVEGDAGHADAVVGRLGDGAGDVGAVAVVVGGVRTVGNEVPAGDDLGLLEIG